MVGAKGFSSKTTGSRAHPPSYSVGTWVFSWGYSCLGMKLTAHCHLVPRLRMHGAIPLLPLQAFWLGQGKLYLYLYFRK